MVINDLRRSAIRHLMRAPGGREDVEMAISEHRTISVFRRSDITTEEDLWLAEERRDRYLAPSPLSGPWNHLDPRPAM